MTEKYRKALDFATEKHSGQFRKGGAPYITHPIEVSRRMRDAGYDEEVQIAALFHDLLEDTDATEEEIVQYGSENILRIVKLLSKSKGYVMENYIQAVRSDPVAFAIKGFDRVHNLQSVYEADDDFRIKYIRETAFWYMDFSPEIPTELKKIIRSLSFVPEDIARIFQMIENR